MNFPTEKRLHADYFECKSCGQIRDRRLYIAGDYDCCEPCAQHFVKVIETEHGNARAERCGDAWVVDFPDGEFPYGPGMGTLATLDEARAAVQRWVDQRPALALIERMEEAAKSNDSCAVDQDYEPGLAEAYRDQASECRAIAGMIADRLNSRGGGMMTYRGWRIDFGMGKVRVAKALGGGVIEERHFAVRPLTMENLNAVRAKARAWIDAKEGGNE